MDPNQTFGLIQTQAAASSGQTAETEEENPVSKHRVLFNVLYIEKADMLSVPLVKFNPMKPILKRCLARILQTNQKK